MNHWRSVHWNDKFQWFLFGGVGIGIISLITFLVTIPTLANLTEGEAIVGILGTLLTPTILGFFLGMYNGSTVQDKTCIYCHKHDFSYTMWKKKDDERRALKNKLESAATKDYEETKQFLKVLLP